MRFLVLLLIALLMVGCTPRVIAAPTVTPLVIKATATATAKPMLTEMPTAIATLTPTSISTQVMVTRVIDGDTIEIEGGERVRYLGIDAPEPNKCYGPEATAKNRELVERKKVTLEKDVSERDAFGRLLRYVYSNGLFINAELVQLGYASVYYRAPDLKYRELLPQLEQEARRAERGLWGLACATPRPTPGTGRIAITYVFYDGIVPRVESDEYVELRNQSAEMVDMAGWKLVSLIGGQTFIFQTGFVMRPGQTCCVYTNEYHPESCGLSFGSGSAIWRNSGDTASLLDSRGKEVSRYGY
jgi:micrococcal nuclease